MSESNHKPWLSALATNSKFQIGLAAIVGICVVRAARRFGLWLSPNDADAISAAITAIAITAIGGRYYEQGKAIEGTVPEGRTPAAPQITVQGPVSMEAPKATVVLPPTPVAETPENNPLKIQT